MLAACNEASSLLQQTVTAVDRAATGSGTDPSAYVNPIGIGASFTAVTNSVSAAHCRMRPSYKWYACILRAGLALLPTESFQTSSRSFTAAPYAKEIYLGYRFCRNKLSYRSTIIRAEIIQS